MRKQVFGRKFKRDANERRALLKGLMSDLVIKESIQTTEEKARAIRSQVEKLVTKAKRSSAAARPVLQSFLPAFGVEKIMNDLVKRFADRPGGYLRIIKLGQRFGDNAKMAKMEWVEKSKGKGESVKGEEKTEPKKLKSPKKPTVAKSPKKAKTVKATKTK